MIKSRAGLLGVLLLFWAAGSLSGNPLSLDEEGAFNKASQLLNQGMYLEAIGSYREIADYSGNYHMKAKALLFMGTTYSLYLNEDAGAISLFQAILEKYPASNAAPDALFNQGMVYYEKGEFKASSQAFERYVKQYPNGMRRQSADVWMESAIDRMGTELPQIGPPSSPLVKDSIIRVLLAKEQEQVKAGGGGRLAVKGFLSGKPLFTGDSPLIVSKYHHSLTINRKPVPEERLIISAEGGWVSLGSVRYRGELVILLDGSGFSIINHVPLEFYLYGVVPREMPESWEDQALMAQAIAARTYALYLKQKSADKAFDVEATTCSQVYGGIGAEREKTTRAVNATQGQVISYQGHLIVSYFHSNSGGYTEDASNVWGAHLPYLKGVPDPYSKETPDGVWECFISYADIEKRLATSGLKVGRLKSVRPQKISPSGRTTVFLLQSESGASEEITGNSFRVRVGADKLKSTLFTAEAKGKGLFFKGSGYGHGVGLSQWGARKMAAAGYSCVDILKHYYQDVTIVPIEMN